MSTELLAYCLGKLQTRPRALNISQPLDKSAYNYFNKAWAKARFEHQQLSILKLPPDHPDYGRSYLWPYELQWSEQPDNTWMLRIQNNRHTNLRSPATPRELILLASVSEISILFLNSAGDSLPRHIFRGAKSRMLGGESSRPTGAVAPGLRPAVASVQYLHQDGHAQITAVNLPSIVIVED